MLAGLILAAIVAAGLVYVMIGLKRSGDVDALGLTSPTAIGDSVVVVRSGVSDDRSSATTQVSTPLLRNAVRLQVARTRRAAVLRRRRGFVLAAMAAIVMVPLALLSPALPSWLAAAAPGPLLVWVVVARISVVLVHRHLDARLLAVENGWDEETALIELEDDDPVVAPPHRSEMSIELSVPLKSIPSLLEPLPVAPATYVSRPVLPRSVHTIDLSAPEPARSPMFPISADMPQDVLPFDIGDGGATGPGEQSGDMPYAV